jgi:DNA-binding NtrC family response regulator
VDIFLPKASTQALAYLPFESAVPLSKASTSGRLLFVEDDVLVRESVAADLEAGGLFVIMAETADAALTWLEAGTKVDFIFSDIVMPGTINGVSFWCSNQAPP